MIIMTKNKVLPWLLTHYTVQAGYFIGYWRERVFTKTIILLAGMPYLERVYYVLC